MSTPAPSYPQSAHLSLRTTTRGQPAPPPRKSQRVSSDEILQFAQAWFAKLISPSLSGCESVPPQSATKLSISIPPPSCPVSTDPPPHGLPEHRSPQPAPTVPETNRRICDRCQPAISQFPPRSRESPLQTDARPTPRSAPQSPPA